MSETRVAILGAYIVALGPLSTSIFTPGLPLMVESLQTTDAAMKFSVSIFFAGFAISQLFCGALSDVFGRKPVTICFLLLYLLATIAAMMSVNVEMLLVARFVQGVGGAIGVSVSRAIVRDLFSNVQSSRVLNLMAILGSCLVATSPVFGGLIIQYTHWRMAFLFLVVMAIVLIVFVMFGIAETGKTDGTAIKLRQMPRLAKTILSDWQFLFPAFAVVGTVGTIYAMSAILPFVMVEKFTLTTAQVGLVLGAQPAMFFTGSIIARLLMRSFSAESLVPFGIGFFCIAAFGLITLEATQEPSVYQVIFTVAFVGFGASFSSPALVTAVMSNQAEMAGLASSILGFCQMAMGFTIGTIASVIDDAVFAYTAVAPAVIILACISGVIWFIRRDQFAEAKTKVEHGAGFS